MSEVGPIAINTVFKNSKDITKIVNQISPGSYILGDNFFVDYKIIAGELIIKSNMCIYDGWFATGDLVEIKNNTLFYRGRK